MAKSRTVRLIFGDDDYRVQESVQATLQEWVPDDQRALGLESIDGALDSADAVCRALEQCREALLTPAFFGMPKTVWLRDITFLAKHPALASESVKLRLRHLADWVAAGDDASMHLLMTANGVDKRTAFYLACKKSATILEFAVPQRSRQADQYAQEQLSKLLAQAELQASAPVKQAIIERAGTDTRQLANEVEKLRAYLGAQGKIPIQLVHDLLPASRQTIIWDFTDVIGRKDLPGALQILRRLLFQKETPVGLLGMLERFVRELILYRHAIDRRWIRRADARGTTVTWADLPPDVDTLFSETMDRDPRTANPYRMGILARTAASFPMQELIQWRHWIVQTYRRMFSGNIPPERQLELLLLQMLGNRRATGAAQE